VGEEGLNVGALDEARGAAACGLEVAILPRDLPLLPERRDRALLEIGG
jgi:hypothetical protein